MHRHLKWKTTEEHSKQIQEHKNLIRSSPYSPGLRRWSSFHWWPCFIMSLSREITMQGLNVSSPEADLLGRVVSWIPQATGVHRLFFFLLAL